MSFKDYQRYRDDAEESRESGDFAEAGHRYTAAGYEILGHANYAQEPFERGQVDTTYALISMLSATLCYRLSGDLARSNVRGKQGILLVEELRDHVVRYDAQRGVMYEYIGDFRLVADSGDWESAYDEAEEYYVDVENVIGWRAEPEFEMNLGFLFDVASQADYGIDRRIKDDLKTSALERRIEFKRDHFMDIVSELVPEERNG
jgi:hypothetical protein